jgi:hypothetical protein
MTTPPAAIVSYSTLISTAQDWLQRPDLAASVPVWVQLAEASLAADERVVMEKADTITLNGATVALPTDCREVTALYYDNPVFWPIEICAMDQVSLRKTGTSKSRPTFAAIGPNGASLYLSPEPDQAYVAQIEYLLKLVALSIAAPTNWLLLQRPDIYLYATLAQSAPYLKEDARVALWVAALDASLTSMATLNTRRKWSANTPVRRPRRPIG